MEIEFKNVNQGDSILIKWNQDDKLKIGLIDCHSDNDNPSLKFIDENKDIIEEIEFVLISHPHFDHFSGVVDLFKFCERHNIPINQLGFTFDTAVTYAYSSMATSKAEGLLEFFEYVFKQHRKRTDKTRTIKHTFPINSETESKNFGEFEMDFLRPIQKDIMSLAKSFGKFIGKINKSEPNLNVYSSVIEIKKDDKAFLFTSDAPKNAFKSLAKYYSSRERKFHLVQIPHHGSIHNHELNFWKNIDKVSNCPSIFSVGDEPKDELPDHQVVDEINKERYKIYSTNNVYGIRQHLGMKKKSSTKPTIMKLSSKVVSTSKKTTSSSQYVGDKSFKF